MQVPLQVVLSCSCSFTNKPHAAHGKQQMICMHVGLLSFALTADHKSKSTALLFKMRKSTTCYNSSTHIQVYGMCTFCIVLCMILPYLGVQKIALDILK